MSDLNKLTNTNLEENIMLQNLCNQYVNKNSVTSTLANPMKKLHTYHDAKIQKLNHQLPIHQPTKSMSKIVEKIINRIGLKEEIEE